MGPIKYPPLRTPAFQASRSRGTRAARSKSETGMAVRVSARHRETRELSVGLACALWMACGALLPANAAAQETRAEEIAAKQKERAAESAPYQPTRFETFHDAARGELREPAERLLPRGWAASRRRRLQPRRRLSPLLRARPSGTCAGCTRSRTTSRWRSARDAVARGGRWTLGARAGWLDAPQVGYFGTGHGGRSRAHQLPFDAGLRRRPGTAASDPLDAA